MPTYAASNRYRADLIDVAWAKESAYGVNPEQSDLAEIALKLGQITTANELLGQWGLVTGGVDLPNPTYEWTPFFGLGVLDRNMMFPVQGRERLEGRIGTVLLCHDSSRLFLEQCLGLIFNGHNLIGGSGTYNADTVTSPAYNSSVGTMTITNTTMTVESAVFGASAGQKVKGTSTVPVAIVIVNDEANTVPDPTRDAWAYIGATGGDTVLNVYMDYGLDKPGWNGITPPSTVSGTQQYSCHSITRLPYDNAVSTLGVTASAAPGQYCYIRPTLVQPSFMIGARFRADDGSNFVTNYFGCKASRVVFNFEEGNPVNYGVDFIAQDMRHNIGEDIGQGSALLTTKYKALTTSASAGSTIPPNLSTHTRVTEQPYFFSRVTLKFHNHEIARFRRFSLTIDNQLDPRYYLNQNETGSPIEGRQVLTEILEGRRNISFSGSLDMDDNAPSNYPSTTPASPTDAQFVRYLLNQSFNDTDTRDMAVLKGIHIQIELRRMADASVTATPYDTMTFSIPSYSATSPAQDRVGMVLRSVSMNVPAPPNIHVPIDIDGFASSVEIRIADNVA